MKKLLLVLVISLFLGCKRNVEKGSIVVHSVTAVDLKFNRVKYLYKVGSKQGLIFYTNHKYSVGDTINKF